MVRAAPGPRRLLDGGRVDEKGRGAPARELGALALAVGTARRRNATRRMPAPLLPPLPPPLLPPATAPSRGEPPNGELVNAPIPRKAEEGREALPPLHWRPACAGPGESIVVQLLSLLLRLPLPRDIDPVSLRLLWLLALLPPLWPRPRPSRSLR